MPSNTSHRKKSNRLKFIIGGLLLMAAVAAMIVSATQSTAEFFMTIEELKELERNLVGQNLRVSGAV